MISLAEPLHEEKEIMNLHGFYSIESFFGIGDLQPSYIMTEHSLVSDCHDTALP